MRDRSIRWLVFVALFLSIQAICSAASTEFEDAVKAIQAVGLNGSGNDAAQEAWPKLASLPIEQLPAVLSAMDGANKLACNWFRGAVDTIVENANRSSKPLPVDALVAFVNDRTHSPLPRRLAYELILEVEPKLKQELLKNMLDDTALELRFEAVSDLIARAKTANEEKAQKELYEQAFEASRDLDQIKACAAELKKLGVEKNLIDHLGLIANWNVIGPFDHSGSKSFDVAYPPESEIALEETYDGKEGKVKWQSLATDDSLGSFDVNKLVGRHKGAIVYAMTEFYTDKSTPAQIRLGCDTGNKIWVNGNLVGSNEVYHASMMLDQYIHDIELKKGRNVILIKVCQNEQNEPWAQTWSFQLRVCDMTGAGLNSLPQEQ